LAPIEKGISIGYTPFYKHQKPVPRQSVVVAKEGVKEDATEGNLTLTVDHYAGANQSALIVEHVLILYLFFY